MKLEFDPLLEQYWQFHQEIQLIHSHYVMQLSLVAQKYDHYLLHYHHPFQCSEV